MTRNLLIVGAAITALSLAACGQRTEGAATPTEQAQAPDANPAATIPTPANEASVPDFVAKAAASNMYEIEAAKLAQAKAKNAEVKKFAAMMVADHTKSSADLNKAIADSGQTITPPAALPADLQNKLDDLNKAPEFDKAYVDNQVDAHQDTLNLLQRYAQDGDVPAIKTFAANTAPVVQKHYDEVKTLRDAMK
jgi:putative membrane protein